MDAPVPIQTTSVESATHETEAVSAVLPAPKFCGTCGTPWQQDWLACESCALRSTQHLVPLDITNEHRAIKSALWLYFTLLAVCAIGIICANAHNELVVQFGVTIGLSVVTLVWCAVSWRVILPMLARLARPAWFAGAVGISLVTFGIATAVINTLNHVLRVPAVSMSDPFLKAGYGWGMVVLCVCVQPAVIEELAFRGVILGALQKALSPIEAILVSAMMFMILHLSVGRFPHTFALGVAGGYLRTRTRSLYPCMLMHFSHNFLCIAVEFVMKSAGH